MISPISFYLKLETEIIYKRYKQLFQICHSRRIPFFDLAFFRDIHIEEEPVLAIYFSLLPFFSQFSHCYFTESTANMMIFCTLDKSNCSCPDHMAVSVFWPVSSRERG